MGKVFNALNRAAETEEQPKVPLFLTEQELPEATGELNIQGKPQKPVQKPSRESSSRGAAKPQGPWDERLVLSTATTGAVAESIRTLRTRILHPYAGKVPRSLLVTSATPGEGKSFICANLAISLAQGMDNHCLLVDCDLRRPAQHTFFGLDNKAGLSDYLQHRKQLPDLFVSSGIEKLSILQGGSLSINPAELLGSSFMTSLVDELVSRYEDRIVLLDSPPLHAASETAILAQHVDGVILVVRYGASRREHVKALVETIGRDKIVGVVFNAYKTNLLDSKIFGYYDYDQEYSSHLPG